MGGTGLFLPLHWKVLHHLEMSGPDPEIERRLAAHPFLQRMSPHHIELLALSAMPTEFDAGQIIFRAGDPANGFYLIETGTVVLEGKLNDRVAGEFRTRARARCSGRRAGSRA